MQHTTSSRFTEKQMALYFAPFPEVNTSGYEHLNPSDLKQSRPYRPFTKTIYLSPNSAFVQMIYTICNPFYFFILATHPSTILIFNATSIFYDKSFYKRGNIKPLPILRVLYSNNKTLLQFIPNIYSPVLAACLAFIQLIPIKRIYLLEIFIEFFFSIFIIKH